MQIRNTQPSDIPSLVQIFQKELPLSIFNQLGPEFIEVYILAAYQAKNSFALSVIKNEKIIGFAIASTHPFEIFQKMILTHPVKLIKIFILSLVKTPALLKDLIQLFIIQFEHADKIKPELLTIAIDRDFQGQRVGSKLINKIKDEFRERGVNCFKVGVWQEMEKPNQFYQKTGAKFYYAVSLYNQTFNYYIYLY